MIYWVSNKIKNVSEDKIDDARMYYNNNKKIDQVKFWTVRLPRYKNGIQSYHYDGVYQVRKKVHSNVHSANQQAVEDKVLSTPSVWC